MPKLTFITSLIIMFFSCGNGVNNQFASATSVTASPPCGSPQKITAIYKQYVYDLSGYEGVGGNSAFNLFDENDLADPKVKTDFNPITSPHPYHQVANYFPKNIGSRIVVDLQIPYKLSEVYLYDMARTSDSVWIYTGTIQNWKLKTAFATKGDITQWGWRKFTLDDSSRFVMFRFNSWEANITESVLYGCPLGKVPEPPPMHYTGRKLPAKTIREFLGINCNQWVPLQFMKPFYNTRLYTMLDQLDADTVHAYPDMMFNLTAHGWWNGAIQDYVMVSDSIVRFNNGRIWYSILGVPKWLEEHGYGNADRPITQLGMNTEDPFSYARHANLFWNLAAAYGNTKVDTSLLNGIFGEKGRHPKFSGRKLMTTFENGNEVDLYWLGNKYCNPVEYFAISSADYDGHEGKMGARLGIKNADSSSELMMSGFCNLDTNRLRVLKFLCNNLRSDHRFLWKGGIQYHHYSTNGRGNLPGEVFGRSTGGLTPEEDSLRKKLSRVREYTYMIQPDVECVLGEWGYDKNRKSQVSAPMVPGYNQLQSHGIMLLRGINAVAFSGFDRLTIYWIKDDFGEDHPALFVSSGVIKKVSNSEYVPYASWYYISTLVNRLGNYIPDKIISEKGKAWVYKYRSKTSPDSVAYFIYSPTHDGSRVNNYELKTGKVNGTMALELNMKENSTEGEGISSPINNGIIKINVTEMPKLIFIKER